MPERIVTCSECQGMFDVGHIPPGREVKCPDCGNALVLSEESAPAPGSRSRAQAAGSSPRTAAPGSSPRTAAPGSQSRTAAPGSQSRAVASGMRRSTPLMRRVMKAKPGGASSGRLRGGSEEGLSGSRHTAASKKNNNAVLVIAGIGALVVIVLAVVVLSGRKKGDDIKSARKGSSEAVTPVKPNPISPATATAAPPTPAASLFKKGSEKRQDPAWIVDEKKRAQVEGILEQKEQARDFFLIREDLYPVVADRLLSDEEGIAKAAADVANQYVKKYTAKYQVTIGSPGGPFIPDLTAMNDPEQRVKYYKEMRQAWDAIQEAMKRGGGVVGPAGDGPAALSAPAAGAASSSGGASGVMGGGTVVDTLRRGGVDRDETMRQLSGNKSRSVPELIRYLETDDPLAGTAVAEALNELTGAGISVPRRAEYKGAEMRARWEDWLKTHSDRLK